MSVVPTLPHFHDTVWTRPPPPPSSHPGGGGGGGDSRFGRLEGRTPPHAVGNGYLPHYHQQEQEQQRYTHLSASPVPTAPFANAGPPGFEFYTPAQQPSTPPPCYNWPRGRRL